MTRMLVATTTVLAAALLNGCGGGSEGGDGSQAIERAGESPERGRLIDSPVSGVHYTTASLSGTTGEDGGFGFRPGETVAFHLGDPTDEDGSSWKLGEVSGRAVVTPLELMNTDTIDQRVVNLLRLLQTLDDDLDPTDGIRIELGRGVLPNGLDELDLSLPIGEFATDPTVLHFIELATGRDALVDVGDAVDHFQINLNELLGDPTGGWVLSEGWVRGERIEGLEASLSFDGAGRYSARVGWPEGNVSVEAEFGTDGLRLDSRILDASVDAGSGPRWTGTGAPGVPVDLASAPIEPPGHALLAAGTDALVRLLPNGLTLESADGAIVLRYVRGDPQDGLPVAFLEVEPSMVELVSVGAQTHLSAAAFNAASTGIPDTRFHWQSSDPSVVTVDGDGTVVAVGEGSATVSVSADGAEASARVDVVGAEFVSNDGETEDGETEAGGTHTGETESRNVCELTQINRSDTEAGKVEQRNASTIEQGDDDDDCETAAPDDAATLEEPAPLPIDGEREPPAASPDVAAVAPGVTQTADVADLACVCMEDVDVGVLDLADVLDASTCDDCDVCPACEACRICPSD